MKGNRGTLREDAGLFAAEQKANGFKDRAVSRHESVDSGHGRIETRKYTVLHDVSRLKERHNWPGLKALVMVESTRETAAKIETEKEIIRLSQPEQLALISALWDSLSDAEINSTPAQAAELKRHVESFEHDRLGAMSWEKLKAELASRAP